MRRFAAIAAVAALTMVVWPRILFAGGNAEVETTTQPEAEPAMESAVTEEPAGPAAPAILEHWVETGNPNAWKIEVVDDVYSLVDAQGTVVPIREYEHIVVTSAGAVEIIYMLGGQDRIAAIGTSRGGIWPEEETSQLPNVGGLARPNFEQMVAFEPDLVIGNGMNAEVISDLNGLRIPSIIHSTDTIAEIMNAVLVLGAFTGAEQAAIDMVSERYAALERVRSALADDPLDLKGAFVYSLDPIQGFREDSLPGEILSILGVTNIAAGLATERPILSPEYILEQNPDFILGAMSIRTEDQILNADSVIRQTRAGIEGNIVIVPSEMILRPTPRVIDALTMLHEDLSAFEHAQEE